MGFEQPESVDFFYKLRNKATILQPKIKILKDNCVEIYTSINNCKLSIVTTIDDVVKTERQKWRKKIIINIKK